MTAPIERMSRAELLDVVQSKGRCAHTMEAARSAYRRLAMRMTDAERTRLYVALVHAEYDEDPAELDEACAELRAAWGES